MRKLSVQIVMRSDDVRGFAVVLRRRWVGERTLSWLLLTGGCPRLRTPAGNHQAMTYIAMIMLMSRRLARP
jgi:hypothetical protein